MITGLCLPAAGVGALGRMPEPGVVEELGLPVCSGEGGSQTAPTLEIHQEEDLPVQEVEREQESHITGGRKAKTPDCQPFVFSEGFPPVPAKLVAKIISLEFVDMAELLRDNMEVERRKGVREEATNLGKTPRREVPDILSWIQCFGIYVSVMASKYPERVQNMLAYQTTLVREARRCGGRGWLAYDTAFRQQAAADPQCDWSKLNSSLYPVTFMAQASGRGRCCPHCLEPDHVGDECALSPRPHQEQRDRQRSPGPTSFTRGRVGGSDPMPSRGRGRLGRLSGQRLLSRVCYSFNDGECRFPNGCRYLHICQRCQAEGHPAIRCPGTVALEGPGK